MGVRRRIVFETMTSFRKILSGPYCTRTRSGFTGGNAGTSSATPPTDPPTRYKRSSCDTSFIHRLGKLRDGGEKKKKKKRSEKCARRQRRRRLRRRYPRRRRGRREKKRRQGIRKKDLRVAFASRATRAKNFDARKRPAICDGKGKELSF